MTRRVVVVPSWQQRLPNLITGFILLCTCFGLVLFALAWGLVRVLFLLGRAALHTVQRS